MVSKRALKTFERPPSLTEKMDITEIVKRVDECVDTFMAKRVNDDRLSLTHENLQYEMKAALKRLRTVEIKDDKDRVVWEDSRAKIIDCMEKLSTPCPFNKQEMFGRDKEMSAIKKDLLKGEIGSSIIIIHGVAGIGKTMLAQYLYDEDPQVCEAFAVKEWINCHDVQKNIDEYYSIFELENRQSLGLIIEASCGHQVGKKTPSALIVFDGWTHDDCIDVLRQAIESIARSVRSLCLRILVTTQLPLQDNYGRFETTRATFHLLSGLQEEESWALFESVALSSEGSNEEKTRIIESKIGLDILTMCGNNPCVINTVASILSTRTTLEEWKHFIEVVWPSLHSPAEIITSNLNLVSFKRLPLFMKRCLLYCSLFPKYYEFNIADFNLWWATEFVNSNSNARVDWVRDEYLGKLQKMGYLIEHRKTDDNDTLSYKMVILSCEFVKNVAKEYNEYQSFGSGENDEHVDDPDTIRHVSFIVDGSSWHAPPWLGLAKNLRSFLFLGESCDTITGIENIISSPRLLDITMVNCEKLARYFGNPELLTSLRLGITAQEFYTEFLTRTQNLRVLDLQRSNAHIIFTQGVLEKLRLEYLYVGGNMFDCGELLSLSNSNVFMMGRNINARDTLADYNYIAENETIDDCNNIYNFCERSLIWASPFHGNENDVVFETLQAPLALNSLTIRRCWNKLITAPRFLNLSSIKIMDCHNCENLPFFGTIPKLKSLTLWNLRNLKYVENIVNIPVDNTHFPSLESLVLVNLPKLKSWVNLRASLNYYRWSGLFPKLKKFQISCTKIDILPMRGHLVSLEANDISIKLLEVLILPSLDASLQTLCISAISGLNSISINLSKLESVTIRQCHELTTLVVKSPCIKSLAIHECGKLNKLSIMACTQLNKLEIECCPELDLLNMIPWKSLTNLNHLILKNIAKLESLPNDLIWLSELRRLSICWVYDLKALPEWICSLTHLNRLIVRNCPRLTTIPESLAELLSNSTDLRVEFRSCCALRRLPESFHGNQSDQLVIQECPKLERSISIKIS